MYRVFAKDSELPTLFLAGDIPDGLEPEPAWLRRIPLTTDGNPKSSDPCEVSDEVFGRERARQY